MANIEIIQGDCLERLKELPDESVDCCITSPPYWGLRDYQTATWEGGDADCDHKKPIDKAKLHASTGLNVAKDPEKMQSEIGSMHSHGYKDICGKCGAKRIDQQLGLEKTPEKYVSKMVEVFREVRRVLKKDGTLWLNLGDSYSANQSTTGGYSDKSTLVGFTGEHTKGRQMNRAERARKIISGLKPKDLVGIPWLVAFALRQDGWYLRQDIIWHKPNPMPESVRDRCTKAHEYIFLLSKSQKYYCDMEAIKEEADTKPHSFGWKDTPHEQGIRQVNRADIIASPDGKRNKRSVWTVTTKPFSGAHFATFPEDLIEPCVKAGCPEGGTILDPFFGAGTTGVVAEKWGRNCIGIELNETYIEDIINPRIEKEKDKMGLFTGIE